MQTKSLSDRTLAFCGGERKSVLSVKKRAKSIFVQHNFRWKMTTSNSSLSLSLIFVQDSNGNFVVQFDEIFETIFWCQIQLPTNVMWLNVKSNMRFMLDFLFRLNKIEALIVTKSVFLQSRPLSSSPNLLIENRRKKERTKSKNLSLISGSWFWSSFCLPKWWSQFRIYSQKCFAN